METNIKANGVIIYNLGKMDKKMVKGDIIIIMEIYMKDHGNYLNFYKER